MSTLTRFYERVGPVWIALAILRVSLVFYAQTGYIHPDEFFQSTEVVAGDLFGLKALRTWEFTSPYPIRSIAIIWVTTLAPLLILKWMWSYVAPGWNAAITFFASDSAADLCLRCIVCLAVDRNVKTKKCRTHAEIVKRLAKRGLKLGGCFLLLAQYPIIVDTFYFYPDVLSSDNPLHVVVTPVNFIRYNLNMTNLESHGRHPNFLHVLVNVPLLFNVLGILALWVSFKVFYDRLLCSSRLESPKILTISKTFDVVAVCTLLMPLCALSLFKHQEPRFLVPLLVPVVLLAQRYASTKLIVFWSLVNALCLAFFGYVHQGGLLPCMAQVHHHLAQHKPDNMTATVVFAHTYMPPRHLLAVKENGAAVDVSDWMGTNFNGDDLMRHFLKKRAYLNYLVAPPSFVDFEMKLWKPNLLRLYTFPIHFSGEHLPQFSYADYINGRVSLSDLFKAFSLNVYLVKLPTTS
ncbi:hypothetical protein MRX96_005934 [Rhipicephalus microplus]